MSNPLPEYTRKALFKVIDILPVAVAVVDEGLTLVLANSAAQTLTNKSQDQLIGRIGGEALGCVNRNQAAGGCGFGNACLKCRLRAVLKESLGLGRPNRMLETTMVLDQKGERVLRFSILPLKLDGKKTVLMTIEDLTEARTHEAEHLEKSKLTAVLETTGGICHELSQPLQVVMGYCDILLERNGLDEETQKALSAISREVHKLADLTYDLTRITRYETKPYLHARIIDIKKSASPYSGSMPAQGAKTQE